MSVFVIVDIKTAPNCVSNNWGGVQNELKGIL